MIIRLLECQLLEEVVGILLEDDKIEVARWTEKPYRRAMLAALAVSKKADNSRAIVRKAQCTQVHDPFSAYQASRSTTLASVVSASKPNGQPKRGRVHSESSNKDSIFGSATQGDPDLS